MMTLGVHRKHCKFQTIKYSQIVPVIYDAYHKTIVDFDLNIWFYLYFRNIM